MGPVTRNLASSTAAWVTSNDTVPSGCWASSVTVLESSVSNPTDDWSSAVGVTGEFLAVAADGFTGAADFTQRPKPSHAWPAVQSASVWQLAAQRPRLQWLPHGHPSSLRHDVTLFNAAGSGTHT